MIGQFITGRVYVFIDAANIFYAERTLGWRVDYQKLREYFMRECELGAIYFYTSYVEESERQDSFLKKLTAYGYIIRSKKIKRIKIGTGQYKWKGNLDVELVMDVMKYQSEFETCILMSGDSDFAPLCDELKAAGKYVITMSVRGHISKELLERTKTINLEKIRNDIMYVGTKSTPPKWRGEG